MLDALIIKGIGRKQASPNAGNGLKQGLGYLRAAGVAGWTDGMLTAHKTRLGKIGYRLDGALGMLLLLRSIAIAIAIVEMKEDSRR
jgi:hypothetical protein